ncbi:putative aminophospholipid-translocase [Rhizophlyctis rosea]|nr:putative aminophospholipid-translocase [Rhizophlyctis rosea]
MLSPRRQAANRVQIVLQTFGTSERMQVRKQRQSDASEDNALLLDNADASSSTESLPNYTSDVRTPQPPPKRTLWQRLTNPNAPSNKPRNISLSTRTSSGDYPPNVVRNQKYNVITFLPIVLYEQFKFFFNLYFLLVALSQFIPALKIGYLFTYFAPLCFVLTVTIGKEAYDDLKRYRRDQEANSQIYERLWRHGWENIPSSDIRVGDKIRIRRNQRVPADCVLLRTTESTGACFIRTDQLDGETDWKLRIAVPATQKHGSDEDLVDLKGQVYAEKPHKDLYSFVGNLTINSSSGEQVEPLAVENMLWSNTVVASGDAVGFVVYTGRETRAVMNTNFPKTKVGLLDVEINALSKILAVVTLALSITMVALSGFRGLWYIYMFRFLILFSSIIPISLRVNLDMGKTVYSMQIMRDENIPDTIVRTSTIPEELGRIEYLLSDKTGTLTKNGILRHEGTFRMKRTRDISARIRDIVLALALCHNVTPVIGEDETISYQASSPDEVAIVKWTESIGITLYARDIKSIRLRTTDGRFLDFEILETFPFTSETKRMGIIVRDTTNGEVVFYEKGADTVMARIVTYNDWLEEECGNMAREGLRTLVIGRKRLSEEAWREFQRRYAAAKISVNDRNEAMRQTVEDILEKELELLGVTGVEDRLQDDVKNTLEVLRNAGIKIWMLTGDKIETATCIAVSSKLFARNQHIHTMAKVTDPGNVLDELDVLQTKTDAALVIDGDSLQTCLDHHRTEFISVAVRLSAVVCCRCSPTQKAEITQLIKHHTGRRTCAIGDGGNDVSMIQAAHVGVGIVGKEGKQASLAADFSVTQFCHLTRLLLWHGRNSYKRSAKLSQFVIHRGLIISVMQGVFSAIFYFAPIALYQGMLLVGYATVFTMAPVFSLVLDKDVSEDIAMMYPELYKELRKGRSLSYKTFFTWLCISIYQGGAIMMLAIWLFENEFVNIVSISFTALIFNELLMVALEIYTWHRYMIYSQIVTIALYISSMWVLKTDFDLSFILTATFVWKTAVITAVSSMPLYIWKFLKWRLNPPSYTKLEG